MEGGRVRPSHGQGRYGVAPPKTQVIVAICVLQIRLPHHSISRRHPRRFPTSAASDEEHGDDHCGSEPSRCVQSWQRTFRSAHQLVTCTPPSTSCVGWEGATVTVDESSPCIWSECVVGLSLCSTQISLVVN